MPPVLEELGQAQRDLVRVRRERLGPGVGVDDQQVHRVGADVQHAEPHGANASGAPVGWAVPKSRSTSPAPGSSSRPGAEAPPTTVDRARVEFDDPEDTDSGSAAT